MGAAQMPILMIPSRIMSGRGGGRLPSEPPEPPQKPPSDGCLWFALIALVTVLTGALYVMARI